MGAKDISKTMTLKDRVTGTLKNINGGTVQYKKNLKELEKTADKAWKAVKVGAMAGAAAIAGAATGFGALVYKTAEAGDRIDKMSQKLGMSYQGFQELEYVLGQNGMEIDQLATGMRSLASHMDGVKQGAKGSIEIFRRLGLDASVAGRTQEEAFKDVISVLQSMPAGAEKMALAQKIFGRSAQELMPLLNAENGCIEELIERFHKLGGAMSDEAVKNSAVFGDTLDDLKISIQGAFRSLAAPALPIFTRGIQWLIDKIPIVKQFVTDAFNAIRQAIENNAEKFDRVKAAIDEIKNKIFGAFSPDGEGGGAINWLLETGIPSVVDGVAGVLSVVTDVYNFIADNWSKFEPLIYGIVGALVAYKLAVMGVAAWKQIAAAAQWVWNAAMNASPIGLIALAIGGLIAVGVLLIRNWDNVKLAGQKTWNSILTGVEWMVNGVIKAFNWMVEQALKPLNKLIEGINKITGASIATVEFGIKTVDFSAAKYDVEGREFDWRWRKEKEEIERKKIEDPLIKALETNTAAVSGNTGALTTNTTAVNNNTARLRDNLSPVDLADSLLGRIERHIWAT